jgi:hypothetical protein
MVYLDNSVLLPLFIREPESDIVRNWFVALPPEELSVSEWTRTEFVSAIGINVRRWAMRGSAFLLLRRALEVYTPGVQEGRRGRV